MAKILGGEIATEIVPRSLKKLANLQSSFNLKKSLADEHAQFRDIGNSD